MIVKNNVKSDINIMEKQFYVLDTIFASDIRYFAGGQVIWGIGSRCPVCSSMIPLQSEEPVKIALNHLGQQGFAEYLWNSHSLPIFRSDIIEFWKSEGFTGFKTKPIQITGWYGRSRVPIPKAIPLYYQLIPVSYIQLIEPSPRGEKCIVCGFVRYGFPETGNHLANGLRFNQNTWDGKDFFGLVGYPMVFCNCRVLEKSLPRRYRHIAYINMSKFNVWETFDIKKWTPKEYSNYLENFLIRKEIDLKRDCQQF
jgi:hypothetical protein